jgi:hypothetical protein
MPRRFLLGFLTLASCANWRALYAGAAPDAATSAPPDTGVDTAVLVDTGLPDQRPPVDGEIAEVISCPASPAPIVLWKFEGAGPPSPSQFVPDFGCRDPNVPLGWDLERKPGKTMMGAGALFLDGGFLFAGIKDSDEFGHQITRAHSLAIEVWLKAMHGESGTIFATNGERDPGRAFSLAQRDAVLHFAIRTSVTDPNGERFVAGSANPGGAAEIVVPLPVDTSAPVQVVATYSSVDRRATVFVDGVEMGSVVHAHPPAAAPVLVWTTGKNQLGLGGTFEGTAWHGWLQLVALYDGPIDKAQAQALFLQGPVR